MKNLIFTLFLSLSINLLSYSTDNIKNESINNRNLPFDTGWKFLRDSVSGAEKPSFNDSAWRTLDLPHDWSIENFANSDNEDHIGPFTKTSEGGVSTGHVKGGTGWYRKHFTPDDSYRMKNVSVCFDGVYMISTVWVNGKKAGDHFYGYTPFSFDISGLLIAGSDNVIAVEVKNPGKNSRWYSGSGIYRHVWLTITNPLRVAENGLYITTNLLSKDTAQIHLLVKLKNSGPKNHEGKLVTFISDMDDRVIDKTEKSLEIEQDGTLSVEQSLKITKPSLWSVDSPHLYRATSQVVVKGKIIDSYSVQFGVRTLDFSAGKGFRLNGIPLELKGACMHHDNGLLGTAALDRAEERRIEIMKANGYNAIRTSHNPPSKQFLEACDRLGMLVIDAAFDMWEHPKNPSDYSNYFKNNWKNDLQSMILRDRNHPSVIAWSIGNEIYERADSSGQRIAKQLVKVVKFPDRIMAGTESFPIEAFENWQQVEKDSWVIGDFVWTGMDYLGESGIGHVYYDKKDASFSMPWPWYNSWCGDIDI